MSPENTDVAEWPLRADGRLEDWPPAPAGEQELFNRLRRLCEEGLEISARIDAGRSGTWHSFVPADYESVLRALMDIRGRGGRFLELGSATGVIAIMADLLGFDSYGIEIAPELVTEARNLASRFDSDAKFVAGSYIPGDYKFVSATGDTRMGAVGVGEAAYADLRFELADFDWVYAYPWPGEAEILVDVMKQRGAPGAHLLLHGYTGGIEFTPVS